MKTTTSSKRTVNTLGRLRNVSKIMLVVSLSLLNVGVLNIALGASQIGKAAAVTDSYPNKDAVCVVAGPQYGVQYGTTNGWCPGYSWGYLPSGIENSSRSYGYRNCTDWAAWRIEEITGVAVRHGLGNAKNWDDIAYTGMSIDTTPEVGDAAVWNAGDYGHVAVVEAVNPNGSVNVSEYNKLGTGVYGTRANVAADHYIDFNGPNPNTTTSTAAAISTAPLLNPAIVSHNGTIHVFARGLDKEIYHKYWTGTSWTALERIAPGMFFSSDPVVISNGSELNVFVIGLDNASYGFTMNSSGSWSSLQALGPGEYFKGNPAAISYSGSTRLFSRGLDNEMYLRTNTNGTWGSLQRLQPNYTFEGDPVPVAHNNELYLFARGVDHQLYLNKLTSSGWSGFQQFAAGLTFSSDPSVVSFNSELHLVARGVDNEAYKLTLSSGGWWTPLERLQPNYIFDGSPTITTFDNTLHIFARGVDKEFYHKYWTGTAWTTFQRSYPGLTFSSDPVMINYDSELHLVAFGVDKELYKLTLASTWYWAPLERLEPNALFEIR